MAEAESRLGSDRRSGRTRAPFLVQLHGPSRARLTIAALRVGLHASLSRVARVPVRILLDKSQPLLERLLPGMSVVTNIHTDAGTDGGK